MKYIAVTTFYLFAFLTSICLTLPVQAQSDKIKIVVDRFIARQEKLEKAVEYKDARKLLRGDVNRDGKEDVIVLYSLEGFFGGKNLWIQYLAVFTNRGNELLYATHQSVGGKNQRGLLLKSIAKGQINFDTQEYLPQDASCCPNGKGRASFTFTNGRLKETKKSVANGKI